MKNTERCTNLSLFVMKLGNIELLNNPRINTNGVVAMNAQSLPIDTCMSYLTPLSSSTSKDWYELFKDTTLESNMAVFSLYEIMFGVSSCVQSG